MCGIFLHDRLYKGKKEENEVLLKNFPFVHQGKTYWYSRSVATTALIFCKNADDKWCVLANQRGSGTPDYQGYWNAICGYLDFNETAEECVQREVMEETGLRIPLNKINFVSVNTNPSANKQNVSLHYSVLLDGTCDEYLVTTEYSEPNEVSDIKWIPLDEIDIYPWAFEHSALIKNVWSKINN